MLYLVSEYAPNGEIFGKCASFLASSPAPVTLKSKCLATSSADPRSRVKSRWPSWAPAGGGVLSVDIIIRGKLKPMPKHGSA